MRIFRIQLSIIMMTVVLVSSFPITSFAATTQDRLNQAEDEKKRLEEQIDKNEEDLNGLKEEKKSLQGELQSLNGDLTQISNNLAELEEKIREKEEEIEITTGLLEDAIMQADGQYESMKVRIQFLYEEGETTYLDIFLNAGNFTDMINVAEYIEALTVYDRNKLNEYREIRDSIEELKEQKVQEKEELDLLKEQVNEEKNRVSKLVKKTQSNIKEYSSQISEAEAAALQYEAEMKKKEEDIKYLKKKLAEEMRLSEMSANSVKRDISDVTFEEGDRYLLANLIYCEAGNQPYEGQLAVGAVVINRVLSSVFPDTIVGVIYAPRQFSPVGSGRLALALAENKATPACYKAADEAMAGMTNVGGCVFFRTPIEGLSGIQIGGHIFY